MPVIQYPHTATVIITSDGGTDTKGYPLPPAERTITLICRAEPNSSNAIINAGDGTTYNFKYVVYIKSGQEDAPVNSRVKLIIVAATNEIIYTDDGNALMTDDNVSLASSTPANTQGNGIVKMYSRGQLNARLWL